MNNEERKIAEKQGFLDGEWYPIATQYAENKFFIWQSTTFEMYKYYRMVFFSVTGEAVSVNMNWYIKKAN